LHPMNKNVFKVTGRHSPVSKFSFLSSIRMCTVKVSSHLFLKTHSITINVPVVFEPK
jgi:hypothetical protein